MSAIKAFVKDRDRVLRTLDESEYDWLVRKWDMPQPKEWLPLAKLAAMHKARVHITTMTAEEIAVSRKWLADNGFTENVGDRKESIQ